MNERLLHLHNQARECYFADEFLDMPRKQVERLILAKFAELIVEECMNVAVNKDAGISYTADVAGYVAAGRSNAARAIKQHFEGI
jgi:hypothetical protein